MRKRLACTAAVFSLFAAVLSAQDGLRSASLSEGGPISSVSERRDLFRAAPDFYTTRPDPPPIVLLPFFVPFDPFGYWYVAPPPVGRGFTPGLAGHKGPPDERHVGRGFTPRRDHGRRRAPEQAPALPPIIPGVPKTFYVIPGCYAGDKPPQPEWLRPGCDLSRLRVIEP